VANGVINGVNGVINGVINEVNGVINGVDGVINGGDNRRAAILTAIKEHPTITKKQLVELTGIPITSLEREMTALRQQNIIKRIGSNKSGYWEVIGTNR
jgi:ATP-dependent DNA helicase RecG